MGAQSFIEKVKAVSAKEGFEILCGEATYEHGNDHYNGTINTCSMERCVKTFDKYKRSL